MLQTSELDGFKQVSKLTKICAIAAGNVSAALDCEGSLYTWGLGDAVLHELGSLADICAGGQGDGTGLARDRTGELY